MEAAVPLGERLSRREDGAFEEAYDRYAPMVRAYVARVVGHSDADDVVQRTFIDVWRHVSRDDPGPRFAGWLFTIARRRSIDTLRSRRAEMVGVEHASDLVGEDGREVAERIAGALELRAALARLPEHERQVIELAYFAGLTHAEVAATLQAPVGTVKARSSRGTRRLARLLTAPGLQPAPG